LGSQSFETKFALRLYILVFILIFLYVHLQFSAAEIAHQLESAEECNKLMVKKAVLDAGLQEYDTFVR
jgi:hypothetical protein